MIFILKYIFKRRHRFYRSLLLFMVALIVLNLSFGLAYYYAEGARQGLSLSDSVWWAMVTMTTVGYGDIYPESWMGRFLVAFPAFFLGIGLVGYIIGTFSERIIEYSYQVKKGKLPVMKKNHIILCGYVSEQRVQEMLSELSGSARTANMDVVLVTEQIEELPEGLKQNNVDFVYGSPMDPTYLYRAGIKDCFGVIILSTGEDKRSADAFSFAVSALVGGIEKEIGRDIRVVTEMNSARTGSLISGSGVDGMIFNDGVSSCLLVQEFLNPGINQVFSQLLTNQSGCQLYIHVTQLTNVAFRDIQRAVIDHPNPLQVIGLIHNGNSVLNPRPDVMITSGDRLIVLAESDKDLSIVESALAIEA